MGSLGSRDGLSTLRITYDSDRLSYKQLLGKFWRSVDPTDDQGQLAVRGDRYRPVIWATNQQEMKDAELSQKKLELINVYKKPFRTSIQLIDESNINEDFIKDENGQDFFKLQANAYNKMAASRVKFFTDTYKPIKTTACEGSVCGYVYFPCSEENGCLDIVNGKW